MYKKHRINLLFVIFYLNIPTHRTYKMFILFLNRFCNVENNRLSKTNNDKIESNFQNKRSYKGCF